MVLVRTLVDVPLVRILVVPLVVLVRTLMALVRNRNLVVPLVALVRNRNLAVPLVVLDRSGVVVLSVVVRSGCSGGLQYLSDEVVGGKEGKFYPSFPFQILASFPFQILAFCV